MSETQGAAPAVTDPEKEKKPEVANGETKAAQVDPDVVSIVIQYHRTQMQHRVMWPENEKSIIMLKGMLAQAQAALDQNQMVPIITKSVLDGVMKAAARGKPAKYPTAQDIERSRQH